MRVTEETPCSRIRCFPQSRCVENEKGQAECRCLPGFQEVDSECLPISSLPSNITTQQDCRHDDRCDVNAQCVYNSVDDHYLCQCHRGYVGDGLECSREQQRETPGTSIYFHLYLVWISIICIVYRLLLSAIFLIDYLEFWHYFIHSSEDWISQFLCSFFVDYLFKKKYLMIIWGLN